MSRPTALVLRHVAFEHLGSLGPALERAGYAIDYLDAALADLAAVDATTPDLLVVLGGPIGVYETEAYPFLGPELELVRARLASGKPLLGICLGAQLIAQALDARVYPGSAKEIGWKPLEIAPDGKEHPIRHLVATPVLHWHGDTFDLPDDCILLASTDICPHQAFSRGSNVLALQFHPEVFAREIEHWLVGHACEITLAGLSVNELRRDSAEFGPALEGKIGLMATEWLGRLHLASGPTGVT